MSLGLAFKAFFKILGDKDFAARVEQTLETPAAETPAAGGTAAEVLSALQREGRFVDFLQEELESFSDGQVGAVARGLHEGCRKVMRQYLTVEPVLPAPEGDPVTVEAGFDASAIRLVGKVEGDPPFTGTLRHHGWRLSRAELPRAPSGADPSVLVPAEVEL
ncbi:MAG: DUF2760 domain-containing protein [Armatimonadetes bacterium]|nr:DUF2760 domain-containing protein [Armatimonadota bacterium]